MFHLSFDHYVSIHVTFKSDLEMKRAVFMFCAGLGVQLVGGGARYVVQDDDQGLQQTTDLGSIQLQ